MKHFSILLALAATTALASSCAYDMAEIDSSESELNNEDFSFEGTRKTCTSRVNYWLNPDTKWPVDTVKVGSDFYQQDELRAYARDYNDRLAELSLRAAAAQLDTFEAEIDVSELEALTDIQTEVERLQQDPSLDVDTDVFDQVDAKVGHRLDRVTTPPTVALPPLGPSGTPCLGV